MPSLEDQFRARYTAATGIDRLHRKQVERSTALLRHLANAAHRGDGQTVHRTWRQLARGLGWADEATTVDEVHRRFATPLRRYLGYLELAGFVEGYEAVYRGSESTGILIRLPAGVAQSVRATPFSRLASLPPRRPACVRDTPPGGAPAALPQPPAPRVGTACADPLFGATLSRPRRGLGELSRSSSLPSSSCTAGRARAPGLTRQSALDTTRVRAALEERRQQHGEEGGGAIVRALPWLAEVRPAVLAREACRVGMPSLADLRLSVCWETQLETQVEQIDRFACRRGAGAELILDLIGEDQGEPDTLLLDLLEGKKPARDRRPRSLGAIAVAVKRWARRQRAERRSQPA